MPLLSFSTMVNTGLLTILAKHYESLVMPNREDNDKQTLSDIAPLRPSAIEAMLAGAKPDGEQNLDELDEDELPAAWPKHLNATGEQPSIHNDDKEGKLHKLVQEYADLFPDELPSGPDSQAKIEPMKIRLIDERQVTPIELTFCGQVPPDKHWFKTISEGA